MRDENIEKIKEIILKIAREMNIEIEKIILFGSRARWDFREDSDYDILIVTKEKLKNEKRVHFFFLVSKGLIEYLKLPVDVIIKSKEEFEEGKKQIICVEHWALKEGLTL